MKNKSLPRTAGSDVRARQPRLSLWSLLVTAVLGLIASAQGAALTVSMMPSYSQSQSYANAAINEAIQVWGRVSGGSGVYTTYTLDFGDGTPVASGSVNNALASFQIGGPDFIQATHAYSSGGSKTVTLTVNDSLGASASRTAVIRVLLAPTHDERVNMAIEKGLIFLYRNQVRYGTPQRSYWTANLSEHGNGATGAALMSFAENGHLASNDQEQDIYAATVQRGVYHAVSLGTSFSIGAQPDGNPDSNGNGRGIWFRPDNGGGGHVYSHSFVTMGVINAFPNAAAAQAALIPAGLWVGGGAAPANFYDFVVDSLDQLYWCQGDTATWKGWFYYTTIATVNNRDGSTHQWPSIAILTAKERWGITPPTWVVNNVVTAFQSLQYTLVGNSLDGSVGYSSNTQWRNSGKTGGALVGYYLGGKLVGTDSDASRALAFIARNWYSQTMTGTGADFGGWVAEFYAMFAVKKGLQLQGVSTFVTPTDSVVHDWYREMSAWLLGNASLLNGSIGPSFRNANSAFGQAADGSWTTSQWPIGAVSSPPLRTAHAILVLTRAVTKPLPVAVLAAIPDQSARNPAPFTLDGSGSFHQDPTASIVEWLYILDAPANPNWNAPTASGVTASVNPGWNTPGVHTVTLRVRDNQNPANTAVATVNVNVTLNDVPPVALPMPPSQVPQIYTGNLGELIVLDGSASFDVDGDPIVSYAWDLDGNGTYGTAADIALDVSGNNAAAATATIIYTSAYNGQIGLRVCSQPRDINGNPVGSPVCASSTKPVDVYGSVSDLFVSSLSAANLNPTVSADISATLSSAAGSAAFNNVLVRFYNGNPLTGGVQLGGNYLVNIPAGGSVNLNVPALALSGSSFVWAFVDANNAVAEYDEANNTASVNVANQPPVARCADVIVSAGENCSAMASINNGSSDPDNDAITIEQIPPGPYPLGQTVVTLVVRDNRGSSSTCTATVTVLDTTPPVIVGCPDNIVVETGPGRTTCDQVVSWIPPMASDNCPNPTFTSTHLPGDTFPVGVTIVTCVAEDRATPPNRATCTFTVTVVDTTPPVIACPADILVNNDAGQCGAVVTFAAPVSSDNCPGASTVQIVGLPSGSTFPTGTTVNTFEVTDAAGNKTSCSFSVTVKDAEAPQVACPADITVNNDAGVCGAVVTFAAPVGTDNCSGATTVQIAGLPSGSTFPTGTTINTFEVTDASGNKTSCSFSVTVKDAEAPQIACPADISVNNDAGVCGAVVTFAAPVGTDNCSGATTVQIAGLPSGSTFPTGTTINTFEVTDASGNKTSCSFSVTVKDSEAPAIACPADILVNSDAGVCGAVVVFTAPVGTDNCSGATTVQTSGLPSGATFPTGTTVNTFVVTDGAGNQTSCSFSVTVNDSEAPQIACPADILVNNDAGVCGATVTFAAPTVSDNCSVATVVQTAGLPSGSVFPTGTTVNTFEVTDSSGNKTSCSFSVTVKDAEAPILTCPENIVASNNPDTCSRSNVVFQATASDNCPGVTIAYSIAPGSTFPVGVTPVTVTATDSSGNQTSCTFTVTINLTENPGGLYPIALSAQTLVGVAPGALLPDIYNGTKPGNFGWLTWATDSNEPTLVQSLTPAGDSFTYQNPANAADNVISIGDWVKGNSGISNSSAVRKALDVLKTIDINVPVWDQTTGNGNNTQYRIVGFAKVRLTSYQLPKQNRISARYLGAACGP